jgi:hypothetical protein
LFSIFGSNKTYVFSQTDVAVILKTRSKLKKIFYPRILFPTIKFIFAMSSLTMLMYVILKIFEKSMTSLKTSVLFSAFFFIFFIGHFTFHLLYFFCFYFKYVVIEKNTISIFELKNFKITKADFDDVLGY